MNTMIPRMPVTESVTSERGAPLDNGTMLELFDYLEDCLNFADCDHGLAHTEAFLVSHGLMPRMAIRWLRSLGADCDCAVLSKLDLTWSAEDERPRVNRAAQGGV